jgi:dTDP-4-dehydrorhamnose reductase
MAERILILGVTGMLGHTLFRQLGASGRYAVAGTARSLRGVEHCFQDSDSVMVMQGVDAENYDSITRAIAEARPDVVVNCIGIIKHLPIANDPLTAITINAQFPHRIALLCKAAGVRMIHISTDCVFSGDNGNYSEADQSDATDLYGRSKFLGEVEYDHCVTLRTSIIGHELKGRYGLVEWFLSQEGRVNGYTNAIYTGFPTIEMSRIIGQYVIPTPDLSGLYHVSSAPISKFDLLRIIAERYGKTTQIVPFNDFRCDRSLNSERFRKATGYEPPNWPELIAVMHRDFKAQSFYHRN